MNQRQQAKKGLREKNSFINNCPNRKAEWMQYETSGKLKKKGENERDPNLLDKRHTHSTAGSGPAVGGLIILYLGLRDGPLETWVLW